MGDDGELGRRSFRPLYGVMVARRPRKLAARFESSRHECRQRERS